MAKNPYLRFVENLFCKSYVTGCCAEVNVIDLHVKFRGEIFCISKSNILVSVSPTTLAACCF